MDDNRILWLKCIISNVLGVFEPDCVNGFMYENINDFRTLLEQKYTKHRDLHRIMVFVWRTFYDKLVEEEITVLEEGNYYFTILLFLYIGQYYYQLQQ